MWRLWNCIPRVLRQQFHGPRASVGVCVEEEKAEHEVETCIKENVNGCRRSSKDQCNTTSFCTAPFGANGPEDEGQKDRAHNKHNDWWKHHCRDNFWSSFCSQHRTLEAVTWGAAVVLGLQLSRRPNLDSYFDLLKSQEKQQQWRSLLFRMAFAMPPGSSSNITKSILPQQNGESVSRQRKSKATAKTQTSSVPKDKTLADVMQDFVTSCQQYTAVGNSVSAVQAADQGNLTTAVKHLQLASHLGHAPAYFNLALCYEMGSGVERDLEQAALYYRMAADVGHAASAFNLALMTLKGEGGMMKDRDKAMQLFRQAAQQGLAQAQTYLGVYYTEDDDGQQDFEQAASFFKAAASQDDAEGQFFLGICYENGWGVDCSDEEAARLYSSAAELGHDGAMYNLAAFHEHGLGGVSCDKEAAMTLYNQSAQLGNESAKFRLQEMEALQAVSQWPEPEKLVSTSSTDSEQTQGLQRSTYSSSPTLTEYLRKSMSSVLAGGLTALTSSECVTDLLPVTRGGGQCSRATFTLGGQDDCCLEPQEHLVEDVSYHFLEFSSQQGNVHCLTGMHRNVTMPELSAVSCH